MKGNHELHTETGLASEAIDGYLFVHYAGATGYAVAGAGERVDGVSQHDAAAGSNFSVVVAGTFPVVTGAAVTDGDQVMSDASGRAVLYVDGNRLAGIARSTTTALGQVASISLLPGGVLIPAAP